ncbi:MAG: hypothetical protein K6B15_09935 [Parasporobacterium sp.]|nr:hypothetical protein [Parasporobacterium sp.]
MAIRKLFNGSSLGLNISAKGKRKRYARELTKNRVKIPYRMRIFAEALKEKHVIITNAILNAGII